jgi:polyisoprenoid-binding protein YceI
MHPRTFAIFLALLIGCSTHLSNPPADSTTMDLPAMPAGAIKLSPRNTRITFVGTALAVSHEGTFTRFGGWIDCPSSDVKDARLAVVIDMNSVYTEIPLLSSHLKASDFFDVANFPTADFVSTGLSSQMIAGDLTLHGVTRRLSFPAKLQIDATAISLDAVITVRQSDFNMQSARTTSNDVPVKVSVRALRS